MESIDFTHSSRQAWQTINMLMGRSIIPTQCPITTNFIASQLLSNGWLLNRDKHFARANLARVYELRSAQGCDSNLSCDFTVCKTELAMKWLRVGKAPGFDNIHPEYIEYQGRKATEWLSKFFSTCMQCLKLPNIWRHAKVIAILKLNKPSDDPEGY